MRLRSFCNGIYRRLFSQRSYKSHLRNVHNRELSTHTVDVSVHEQANAKHSFVDSICKIWSNYNYSMHNGQKIMLKNKAQKVKLEKTKLEADSTRLYLMENIIGQWLISRRSGVPVVKVVLTDFANIVTGIA